MSPNKSDPINAKFHAAIDRLVQRAPEHPDLVERMKKGKALAINPVNVAKEAGLGRSTLYERPEIVQRICEVGKGPRDLAKARIAELEAANKRLIMERKQALDLAAATILRMRKLQKSTVKAQRRAERDVARPNPNQMGDNVVPLRP